MLLFWLVNDALLTFATCPSISLATQAAISSRLYIADRTAAATVILNRANYGAFVMSELIVLIKLGVVCGAKREFTSCLVIRQRQVATRVFITSSLFSDVTQR